MKKTLFTLASLLFSVAVFAQSADEIISQYLENTGGADNWAKVTAVKIDGKVNVQGMDLPIEVLQTTSGKMRMKFELQGQELVQTAFDGNEAWGVNFMTMQPEKSESEVSENMKREIGDFPDPFLNYKEKGYTIELLGKETVEGTECFKIKLTKKPLISEGKEVDNVSFYFFDTDNMVPIMMEREIKYGPAKGMTTQTLLSDYQEVDGLYFAFSVTEQVKGQGQGQTINFTKITVNPEIDESVFEFKN